MATHKYPETNKPDMTLLERKRGLERDLSVAEAAQNTSMTNVTEKRQRIVELETRLAAAREEVVAAGRDLQNARNEYEQAWDHHQVHAQHVSRAKGALLGVAEPRVA